jgi:hypothetical protein
MDDRNDEDNTAFILDALSLEPQAPLHGKLVRVWKRRAVLLAKRLRSQVFRQLKDAD